MVNARESRLSWGLFLVWGELGQRHPASLGYGHGVRASDATNIAVGFNRPAEG